MEKKQEIIKQILCFLFLTSLISVGVFVWMFHGARNSMPAVLLMMYVPGLSAIMTSLIFKSKIGDFGWRPGRFRFLAYGYLLPFVVSILGYGPVWLSPLADITAKQVINYRWAKMLGFSLPVPFLVGLLSKMILAFLLTLFFTLGEEAGWSGFLTPKLRTLFSVPITSLLVGVCWAVWHFPAIVGGLYGYGTPLGWALPGFTLVLVGASLIRTVLIDKSKSFWPGVVLHASHNVILMGIFNEMTLDKGTARLWVSETGVYLGIVYIGVALVFWAAQKRSKIKKLRKLTAGANGDPIP